MSSLAPGVLLRHLNALRIATGTAVTLFLLSNSGAANASDLKSDQVYSAWLQMYDLKFEVAHRALQQWRQTHGDFTQPVSMNKHGESVPPLRTIKLAVVTSSASFAVATRNAAGWFGLFFVITDGKQLLFLTDLVGWVMAARQLSTKSELFYAALLSWFLFVAIVCLRVGLHPGSHSVFTEYRDAGRAWLHQTQIYGADTRFLYSPLVAALYSPFALISQNLSEVLWRLVIGLALPLALWLNARELFHFSKLEFACLLLLILPLTLSDLNSGQANIVIIVLLLLATSTASQSRWLMCAFYASFAVYWKIYPISFALLLAIIFPRELSVRLLLGLVGLFAVSLLLQKPSYVLHGYGSWFANLASDRRRELEYYGKWRDFYLLLRLVGITISAMWWKIVQVIAGFIAATICLVGTIRRWPLVTLLFCAMSLAIVWMLLFGPATEAATYMLIAVPSAYLLISGWSGDAQPALQITSTVTYLGFLIADMLNS